MHAAESGSAGSPNSTATRPRRARANCCSASASPRDLHQGPMARRSAGLEAARAAGAGAVRRSRTSCCWTSRPTTSTSTPSAGWKACSTRATSTMVIISHDRHFLNSVCTHMADLDYGTLRVYPGNYDDYMIASTQARERLLSQNAKAKDRSRRAAGIRAPLLAPTSPRRARRPRAPGRSRRSRSRTSSPRAGRTRTSASISTAKHACIDRRSRWTAWPRRSTSPCSRT